MRPAAGLSASCHEKLVEARGCAPRSRGLQPRAITRSAWPPWKIWQVLRDSHPPGRFWRPTRPLERLGPIGARGR